MIPFTAVASAIGSSTARDVLALKAPTDRYVAVHRVTVTLDATGTDHLPYELYKGTAYTGGTAVTPNRTDPFLTGATGRTYAGTCVSTPTTTTKSPSTPVVRKALPIAYGWEWCDDDGVELRLAPGEVLVVRQAGTTAVATTVAVEFEVL